MTEKTIDLKTHIGEFKFKVGKDYSYTSSYVYNTFANKCTLRITPRYGRNWVNEFKIVGIDPGECKAIENFYDQIERYSFQSEKKKESL